MLDRIADKMRQDRRRFLRVLTALAVPGAPLVAAAQGSPSSAPGGARLDSASYLRLQALVRPALEHMRRRQWMAAAQLLLRARDLIDEDPESLWPWRCYVLPPLGVVLLELQQPTQALVPLLQAREAERRLARGEGDPRMRQAQQVQADGFSRMLMATEFKRQLLEPIAVAGRPRALALEQLLFDSRAGAHASLLPLARTYAMSGDGAALAELYRGLQRPQADDVDPSWQSDARPDKLMLPAPPVGEEYTRFSFGVLLASRGETALAAQALDEALALNWLRLRWVGGWVPSIAAHAATFGIRRHQIAAALGVAWQQPLVASRARHLVARIVESKGLGVRHAERMRRLLAQSTDPTLIAARRQLQDQEDLMAQQFAVGAQQREGTGPGQDGVVPAEYTALITLIQGSLGESLALEAALPTLRQAGLGEVFVPGERLLSLAQAARPEAAFIGYFAYAGLTADSRSFTSHRYARYTLAGDELTLADLGSKRDIDAQLARWRAAARSRRTETLASAGQALRESLLAGLPQGVQARRRWIFDPDGPLALLPFEALPGHDAPHLLDERCISQVTSLASLISEDPAQPLAVGDARVIADPAYPAAGAAGPDERHGGLAPVPLPETRNEAAAVAAAWARMGVPAQSYVGTRAVRDALPFSGPAPRYLHVAAHGLMLQALADDEDVHAPVEILLPGRQTALALAQDGQLQLITASELQRLHLQGTALVVLSACDTGNGEATTGEGVDSLRRAVEVAGARASMTAIWPVPSQATVALMETFYRYMADGQPPAEALRAAKLALRARYPAPLDWAGFVLAGKA
jgi:CHAT domain-containing protein